VVREILHRRGSRVAAGAALATLESAELSEPRTAYARARADLVLAERNLAYWRRGLGPHRAGAACTVSSAV
jgi:multidrug efflux pump subunit AcrA (membrane-fusion protein)